MFLQNKYLLIFILLLTTCSSDEPASEPTKSTRSKKSTVKVSGKEKAPKNSPTLTTLVEEKASPSQSASPSAPPQESKSSGNSADNCRKVYQSLFSHYQRLSRLVPKGRDWAAGLPKQDFLQSATISTCDESDGYEKILGALSSLLNNHTNKIGVLLPLRNTKPQYILNGLQRNLAANLNLQQDKIISYDSSNMNALEVQLAELIFLHQVATIVGGYDAASATQLKLWSDRLMIPMVLLSEPSRGEQHDRVFYVYPTLDQMGSKIMREAKAYHWTRLGLIYPVNGDQSQLANTIQETAKKEGITVTRVENYTTGNYESMDAMAKKLFVLEQSQREEEYQAAYLKAKKIAESQKIPFQAKNVVLQPKIEFDALIVLDQYRMIRHLAKMFQFYGVRSLKMIGNQEWRGPGIIEPYDPFLEGSFFVDIIGSYLQATKKLGLTRDVTDNFAPVESLQELDFKYIGYKLGDAIAPILKNPQIARRKLHETMLKSKMFEAGNQYKWPMEVFTIRNRSLISTSLSN